MADLRKFSIANIEAMAQAIATELDDFTASIDQLERSLSSFKFRGPDSHWTIAPRSRQWYRSTQAGWQRGTPYANLLLEGLELSNAWIVAARRNESLTPSQRTKPQASSATDFIVAMVQETRQAYDRGEISSSSAETSLEGFYLLDRNGRFWIPGYQTGSWYYFESGRWNRALTPPPADSLLNLEPTSAQTCTNCGAALGGEDKFCRQCGTAVTFTKNEFPDNISQAVVDFIQTGIDVLPEPVTEDWSPPNGFPELIRQCPVCGKSDVGNHTHCRVCRSPLPFPEAFQGAVGLDNPPGPPPVWDSKDRINPSKADDLPYPNPRAVPARRSQRPWILGTGCGLVLLCAVCGLLFAGFAYYMDSVGYTFGLP
jgi:hypothetical protein